MLNEKSPYAIALKKRARAELSIYKDNFRLLDSSGRAWLLSNASESGKVVLVAFLPGCRWAKDVANWAENSAPTDAGLLFLNPERPQSREASSEAVREGKSNHPVLMDFSQTVSRGFGFSENGDFLVLDTKTWLVSAAGKAFDSIPGDRTSPFFTGLKGRAKRFLAACPIHYAEEARVLDEKVTSALQRTCLQCHERNSEIDQFRSAKDLQAWHEMNRQLLRLYRMPIGGVDYTCPLCNNGITEEDLSLVLNWIENGEPTGSNDGVAIGHKLRADRKLKAQMERRKLKPDLVWEMKKPDHIAAVGDFRYAYEQVAGPTPKDYYVNSAELETNLTVTHHVNVFVSSRPFHFDDFPLFASGNKGGVPKKRSLREDVLDEPILGTWSRSKGRMEQRPGTVFLVPKGSYIILQHHYEPSGKPESSRSSLRIFLDRSPENKKVVHRIALPRLRFTLKPGEENHELVKRWTTPNDISISMIWSHGHLRKTRYFAEVKYPDGTSRTLCNVPFYSLKFEPSSMLYRPVFVPKGSTIEFHQIYDNSPRNPANPDPAREVHNGSFTETEEMDFARILYVDGRLNEALDLRFPY